ncbi:hypothetical protein RHMOL_Rhmol06G0164400 [Rhododendron molle]|uniref:Uncharacterized protein n=1 Tax=Rhododendron molle TaxID=49168 RepID=A0ACC0ND93_RHOML|nr:hypothetical protein RHMOL_Rhmol06G0164400 [Rhododendron molle]
MKSSSLPVGTFGFVERLLSTATHSLPRLPSPPYLPKPLSGSSLSSQPLTQPIANPDMPFSV